MFEVARSVSVCVCGVRKRQGLHHRMYCKLLNCRLLLHGEGMCYISISQRALIFTVALWTMADWRLVMGRIGFNVCSWICFSTWSESTQYVHRDHAELYCFRLGRVFYDLACIATRGDLALQFSSLLYNIMAQFTFIGTLLLTLCSTCPVHDLALARYGSLNMRYSL